jgi:hypothetical protein
MTDANLKPLEAIKALPTNEVCINNADCQASEEPTKTSLKIPSCRLAYFAALITLKHRVHASSDGVLGTKKPTWQGRLFVSLRFCSRLGNPTEQKPTDG